MLSNQEYGKDKLVKEEMTKYGWNETHVTILNILPWHYTYNHDQFLDDQYSSSWDISKHTLNI